MSDLIGVLSVLVLVAANGFLAASEFSLVAVRRSESTALWIVRPLALFLFVLKPAIVVLNGLGNLVLRLCGLQPGAGEESLHSAEELKLLVSASQEAGLLQRAQQEVVERVFNMGDRPGGDIMTTRTEIDWVDCPQRRGCMMRNAVCPCRSLSGK